MPAIRNLKLQTEALRWEKTSRPEALLPLPTLKRFVLNDPFPAKCSPFQPLDGFGLSQSVNLPQLERSASAGSSERQRATQAEGSASFSSLAFIGCPFPNSESASSSCRWRERSAPLLKLKRFGRGRIQPEEMPATGDFQPAPLGGALHRRNS